MLKTKSQKKKKVQILSQVREKNHLVALIPKAVTKYLSPFFDQEVQL